MKAILCPFSLVCLVALAVGLAGCGRQDTAAPSNADNLNPSVATPPLPASVAGYWVGNLEAGATPLSVGFNFVSTQQNQFRVAFDSLNQGLHDLPATAALVARTLSVELDLREGGLATYTGELSVDGKLLKGSWKQGEDTLPLELKRGDRAQAIADMDPHKQLRPADMPFNKAAGDQISGEWRGSLELGPTARRIVFHITRQPEGICTAQMTSLDQGNAHLAVEKVLLKGEELTLQLPGIHGRFVGLLQAGGSQIIGKWFQTGLTFPLTLQRTQTNP